MSKTVAMGLPVMFIDAFSSRPFAGNPAAVCPVPFHQDVSDTVKQRVAAEINLSETAFVQLLNDTDNFQTGSRFGLRWFTPTNEVPLCGHATLATAAALFKCMGNSQPVVTFETLSGELFCRRDGEKIMMDFPLNQPEPIVDTSLTSLVENIAAGLTITDLQYSATTKKLLIRLHDKYGREDLERLQPDPSTLMKCHDGSKVKGCIVTLRGRSDSGCVDNSGAVYDFVSRYFAPWNGINEDPVTGSAHTVLGPYWARVLGKDKLYARQCSSRGGDVHVTVRSDGRVDLAGESAVVIEGHINLE